jgi:hypothetical protein
MAFYNGYARRRKITVENTGAEVSGQQLTFNESRIDLRSISYGGNVRNSSGFDIIFTDGFSRKLTWTLDSYDQKTGNVQASITVTTIPNGTSFLYMYYDNPDIDSFQG